MNLAEMAPYFADEHKAISYVERLVWPNGPVCPHCGSCEKIYRINGKRTRPGLRKCGNCRKQFTVKVGTIFEDSHIPMTKWLMAISLMCSSKKGISAKQLSRALTISYKSAWFMCHRVRVAMTKPPLSNKLGGVVEVDETYVGGKPANNRRKQAAGRPERKIPVMALIERGGRARLYPMPNEKHSYMKALVRLNVDDTAHIMTDGHKAYRGLDKHFASHDWVDHSKEMVRGIIHTNFAESCHSLLKRSIIGTHHHMSRKHMPKYLREREFHWNMRHESDSARTKEAIRGVAGKRLMYRTPVDQS